jgi:anti-sigma regulatory factor (Ser/Thr protein kinase)
MAEDTPVDMLLPAAATAPAQARRALRGRLPLAPDLALRASLLVSELVTNSVRHGRLHESETVRLRAHRRPRAVRVEVEDAGPGFDPEKQQPPDLASDRGPPLGGYGLQLVEDLADRWGVERDQCTCVWFELDTEPSPAR